MSENAQKGYIGYEYKEIMVSREMESVYVDGYENFGWVPDEASRPFSGIATVTVKLKRDRKIRNKAELTRLQRQFETCVSEIVSLENSKTTSASIIAFVIGIVGCACMAGATFAYLAGMIPLMIALAIPGFVGFALPYFCYRTAIKKRTANVVPLIDAKYDEIYDVCERANALIA